MIVELKQHKGQSVGRSGRTIIVPQYRIYVDGQAVGYIGWKPGSIIKLTRRYGPIELKEISKQVAALLECDEPATAIPPELPQNLPEQQDEIPNDFIDP